MNLADRKVRVPISLIYYVELVGHNLVYHTEQGDFSLYGSMKVAEEKLNPSVFFRCNSCYLVNLNYVESIEGSETVVAGQRLQISRARKKAFVQQMNQFLGGNY